MTFENATAALGLIGFGGILGNYFQIFWQRRSSELSKQHELKERRYKCLIVLMHAFLNFAKRAPHLEQVGRHFTSQADLLDELKMEWHNMILFASDDALKQVHSFIQSPSVAQFKRAALAMRADLWGGEVSTDLECLDFEAKP